MKRLLLFCLLALPALATTSISVALNPGTSTPMITPQQIVVVVTTDQASCNAAGSLAVYEGTSATGTVINDVNGTLFTNADKLDSRASTFISGSTHMAVVGLRRAEQAADGKFYSRSPPTDTSLFIQAKCGTDTVSLVTATSNIPLGNTWAEPYRYDPANPQGYAWPTIDFTDKSKIYVDPTTGALLTRVTGPEDQAQDDTGPTSPTLACSFSYAPAGNWTSAGNGCGPGSLAVSTSTDPLAVVLGAQAVATSTTRTTSYSTVDSQAIDDIKIRVHASSMNGTANNASVCLSVDGSTCATAKKNITIPTMIGDVDYPSGTPTAYFSEWLDATHQTPPNNPDMAQRTGTLLCTGTALLYQSGISFNMATWAAGTRIVISGGGCAGGTYTIASVTNVFNITLTGSAGTSGTESDWTVNGLSVLIFPQAGDILSVDNITSMNTQHPQFAESSSGDQQYCNDTTVMTSMAEEGWICTLNSFSAPASSLYFVPKGTATTPIGSARMITSQWFPGIADSPVGDGIGFGVLGNTTGGDMTTTDPNVFYYFGTNASRGEYAIARGTYNPAGSGTNDYQKYTPATNSQEQNAAVTWVNLTKHSVGGTLTERQAAFDNRFDPNWNGAPTYITSRNGYILVVNELQQDAFCWITALDSSGNIVSMAPSYINAPTRWSPCHSESNAGGGDYIQFSSQKATQNANTPNSRAFYNVVTAINGSGGGTLSTTATNPTCAGSHPSMAGFLARGSGCDLLTVSGPDSCKIADLTVYELAHFPVCSWNIAFRGLRLASEALGAGMAIALADTIFDAACGDNLATCEFMMVVGISGNDLIVLRNYSPPTGPFLTGRVGVVATHAAGFTLGMAAGQATNAANVFLNFVSDTHGTAMVNDYTYFPTAHGDQAPIPGAAVGASVQVSDTYSGHVHCYSVRTGSFATQVGAVQSVGSSPNPSECTGGVFGGVPGCGFSQCDDDDHPSVRASQAPVGERTNSTSGVKLGAFNCITAAVPEVGGIISCDDPITITQVTGSGTLYIVDGYQLQASINIKYRPILMWAGRHNMKEISGPTTGNVIGTTSSDNWKFCYAYLADECRAGSSPGTLYANIPNATIDGTCANATYQIFDVHFGRPELYANYPCALPIAPDFNACTQLNWGFGAYSNGEYARRLAQPFAPWEGTSDFFNCGQLPDNSGVFIPMNWANNVRSDIYYLKLPPTPEVSSVDRSTYVSIPVAVPAGAAARIQFGYLEFGGPTDFYCTTRLEACATDTVAPFAFATSDTAHYTACASGCTINVHVIPTHVAYYAIQRMGSGVGALAGIIADGEPTSATSGQSIINGRGTLFGAGSVK